MKKQTALIGLAAIVLSLVSLSAFADQKPESRAVGPAVRDDLSRPLSHVYQPMLDALLQAKNSSAG
jgi:hypothetical protein